MPRLADVGKPARANPPPPGMERFLQFLVVCVETAPSPLGLDCVMMPIDDRTATTSGEFNDMDDASRAVRELSGKSVPADSIRVFLLDAQGQTMREVPVEDEAGALRGALIGGAIGAVLGVIVVFVAMVLALRGDAVFDGLSVVGAFAAIASVTAACVPLGALWGTGHWRGRTKLTPRDRDADRVRVVVESGKLAGLASQVLREAGAEGVTDSGSREGGA